MRCDMIGKFFRRSEEMRCNMIGKFFGAVILCAVALGGAATQAEPLDLTTQLPDFSAGTILVEYDATSDIFAATGQVTQLEFNGVGDADYQVGTGGNFETAADSYQLEAVIDASGNLDPNASTLSISGEFTGPPLESGVPNLNGISGTLLTAKLTDFGFSTSTGGGFTQFEFTGTVTGGEVASHFGGVGQPFGVILTPSFSNPAPSNFEENFTNDIFGGAFPGNEFGAGQSDNFRVPEPASATLLMLGGVLFGRRRRTG